MNHRSIVLIISILYSTFSSPSFHCDRKNIEIDRNINQDTPNQRPYIKISRDEDGRLCICITRKQEEPVTADSKFVETFIGIAAWLGGYGAGVQALGTAIGAAAPTVGAIALEAATATVVTGTVLVAGAKVSQSRSAKRNSGGGGGSGGSNGKDKGPKNKEKLKKQKQESKSLKGNGGNNNPKDPEKNERKIDPLAAHLEPDKYRANYTGNRIYEPNPKHHVNSPPGIGKAPENGYKGVQEALIVPGKEFLVGVENGKIVQYNLHAPNTYHGYIVEEFHQLDKAAQEALVESGLARSIKSGKLL